MKAKICFAVVAVVAVVGGQWSFAQTNSPSPAGGTPALPGGTPALPGAFQQATNQSGSLAVFNAALSLLPAWNPALTNSFETGEFTLESAPLWKSMSAAGTTPYNSTEADYFFTRNLGLGAEMI